MRAWEYRQRNLARGVWGRLRALLADSARVCVISDADADALEASGERPAAAAGELAPQRRWYVIPAARLESLASRREITVRLSAELLAAPNLALVPFA